MAVRYLFLTYEMTTKLFLSYSSHEVDQLDSNTLESGQHAVAALDLDRFSCIGDAYEEARCITGKKGRVTREVARARRLGYFVEPFPEALFVPDIHAIHHSKKYRDHRPMKRSYLKTVDDMGGAPTEHVELTKPACLQHHYVCWGVFEYWAGHMQGEVTVDRHLVGYIKLRRNGNTSWYHRVLGHGDHLSKGVMYLLHFELLRHYIEHRPRGLRYLIYHRWKDMRGDSQHLWKQKVLFQPHWVVLDKDRERISKEARFDEAIKLRNDNFPMEVLPSSSKRVHVYGQWSNVVGDVLSYLYDRQFGDVYVQAERDGVDGAPPSWVFGVPQLGHSCALAIHGSTPARIALGARRVLIQMDKRQLGEFGQKVDGVEDADIEELSIRLERHLKCFLRNPSIRYKDREKGGRYWFWADVTCPERRGDKPVLLRGPDSDDVTQRGSGASSRRTSIP